MSRYINRKELGRGGFGIVYSCIRQEDGLPFANKVLNDNTPEVVRRFQREVRMLSALDHPRNRWAVMGTAAGLIESVTGNDEAIAVARALQNAPGRLVDIEDRLERKKLHPIIRELLDQTKKTASGHELIAC